MASRTSTIEGSASADVDPFLGSHAVRAAMTGPAVPGRERVFGRLACVVAGLSVIFGSVASPRWTTFDEATLHRARLAARASLADVPDPLAVALLAHLSAPGGPGAPFPSPAWPRAVQALAAVGLGLLLAHHVRRSGPGAGDAAVSFGLVLATPVTAIAVVKVEGFGPLLAANLMVATALVAERAWTRPSRWLAAGALAIAALASHPTAFALPLIVVSIVASRHALRRAVATSAPAFALVLLWPFLPIGTGAAARFHRFAGTLWARWLGAPEFPEDAGRLLVLAVAVTVVSRPWRTRSSWILVSVVGAILPHLLLSGPQGVDRNPLISGGCVIAAVGVAAVGCRGPRWRTCALSLGLAILSAAALLALDRGSQWRELALAEARLAESADPTIARVLLIGPSELAGLGGRDILASDLLVVSQLRHGDNRAALLRLPPLAAKRVTPGDLQLLGLDLTRDRVVEFDGRRFWSRNAELQEQALPTRRESARGFTLTWSFANPHQAHAWVGTDRVLGAVHAPSWRGDLLPNLESYTSEGPEVTGFLSPPLPSAPYELRIRGRHLGEPAEPGWVAQVVDGRIEVVGTVLPWKEEDEVRVPLVPAPSGNAPSPRLLYVPGPVGSTVGLESLTLVFPAR